MIERLIPVSTFKRRQGAFQATSNEPLYGERLSKYRAMEVGGHNNK